MATVVLLKDLYYRYSSQNADWILKGIHLRIRPGDYVALFGGSGSGKSTLAYTFNGLIPHFFGGILEGEARVCGKSIRHSSPSELFQEVGLVIQNTDAHLFSSSVHAELAFGLESLGVPFPEIEKRISEVSRSFALDDLLDRSPHELSGGEKQRVAIASVFCLRPRILVLDEPFAHLDPSNRRRIRSLLRCIRREGTTLVVVEHTPDPLLEDASRAFLMDRGSLAEHDIRSFEHFLEEAGILFRWETPPPSSQDRRGDVLLEVTGLTGNNGASTVLYGISFSIRQGERVALLGENGAGKTTLLKHLVALRRPRQGDVRFRGKSIYRLSPHEIASKMGISFQNPNDQFFKTLVRDEVLAGVQALSSAGRTVNSAWVHEVFDLFGLEPVADRSPYRLSEGEKKRVSLASSAAMDPQMLIWDEPTAGQDGRFRRHLARLVHRLSQQGKTFLIATHDLEFARATCSRALLLERGRITADGPPEDVIAQMTAAYTVPEPDLNPGGPQTPSQSPASATKQ